MTRYFVQRAHLSSTRCYGSDIEVVAANEHEAEASETERAFNELHNDYLLVRARAERAEDALHAAEAQVGHLTEERRIERENIIELVLALQQASDARDQCKARLASITALCGQEGCDGEPYDTFYKVATGEFDPHVRHPATAGSASAASDLMQHCCPSCGQPSGKGIDLFTYMAELVTKHPTAKGMLDLAMARATTGSASVSPEAKL